MVVKKQPKKKSKEKFAEDFEKEEELEQTLNEESKQEEPEELEKENLKIKELEKELETLKDLNLRLKAEFENFKKRTAKEKISIYDVAKVDCVTPFLEVLDNLERAIGLVVEKNEFSEGINLVINKFYDVLKNVGVVEIKSLGENFNPNLHEAIKVVEDEKFEKNTICEVLQKGFKLNEKVLRHALVVVANP